MCFDLEDSKGLLLKVREAPILENEVKVCEATVANLNEQVKAKDALLEIAEERRKLQEERAGLYQEMFEKQKKITDQYEAMVARLESKQKTSDIRTTIQTILGTIVGIFLGRTF